MDWGTVASIASSIVAVASVIGMLKASTKNRAEEIQSIRDDFRDRLEANGREEAACRRAIYEDMERRFATLYEDMNKRFERTECSFVRREMCEVIHGTLKEGIEGVRRDLRRLNETDGG